MEQFNERQKKDLKVLITFVGIYCRAKHGAAMRAESGPAPSAPEIASLCGKELNFCRDCASLVAYAMEKRRKCPLDPKPSCKHCPIHCYGKEYRARIREVMAFSGRRMIMRGRLDLLWHYLF